MCDSKCGKCGCCPCACPCQPVFIAYPPPPPPPEVKACPVNRPIQCCICQDCNCTDPCSILNNGICCERKCLAPPCPTGFKPCHFTLRPPGCNNPFAPWRALLHKCPPTYKPKKKLHDIEPCCDPCCKHWKPEPECCYDLPCKAHCFNHPPGIKPGRRLRAMCGCCC